MSQIKKNTKKEGENLSLPVYNIKGEEISKVFLSKKIANFKINNKLIAQTIRVYLSNKRQGNASTKDRGEVSGSTRKIYRQKGTGRARHGSIKAPIFVGGGVVGGPKPRDYSLKINKKQKRQALLGAFSFHFKNNNIFVLSDELFSLKEIKTKIVYDLLKKLKIENKKILFVLPQKKTNFYFASRNISNTSFINSQSINSYDILRNQKIVFFESSFEEIKKNFLEN